MKSLLFAFVFICVVSFASAAFNFVRNVSVSGAGTDDVSFRFTEVDEWNFGALAGGVYFKSISAGRTKNSAEGDAVWGASWIGLTDVPLGFLSYWEKQASWDSGTNFADLNVSAAAGYIASAYLALEERSPNGTLVTKQPLKDTLLGFQWKLTDTGTGGDSRIKYAIFTGSAPSQSWNITLTHIVSDVVGVLNVANAVISPKAYETIVTINNWPYQSSANSLVLILAVASGQASANAHAFFSGNGTGQVYFRIGATATVDGVTKSVTSSGFTTDEYDGWVAYVQGTSIYSQLQGKFGGDATVHLVKVSFPAGGNRIVFDPDVGAGNPVDGDASSAASVSIGIMLIAFCVLLSFF